MSNTEDILRANVREEHEQVHRLQARLAEVIAERDAALEALKDAATSLETIQLRSYGEESYLDSKHDMRAYAGSRAGVARAAIAKLENK